jgi:hypothetical protein
VLVTYAPEDGEPQTWTWTPGRVLVSECAIVEKVYGKSWELFAAEVQQGSMQARRVLLWHLQRRAHPMLRFEDAPDFYADQLVIEYDASELRAMRDGLATSGLAPAEREMALAAIDREIAAAEFRGVVGEGKAASSSDS